MQEGGCKGDTPLTQRGASSGLERSETSQKSRWLTQPDPSIGTSSVSRPVKIKKNANYTQIRVYLPNDTVRKLLALPPCLRTTVLSMRLRAMDWGIELDPVALQKGCGGIKESCAVVRQAVVSGFIEPKDREGFNRLVTLLEEIVHT